MVVGKILIIFEIDAIQRTGPLIDACLVGTLKVYAIYACDYYCLGRPEYSSTASLAAVETGQSQCHSLTLFEPLSMEARLCSSVVW